MLDDSGTGGHRLKPEGGVKRERKQVEVDNELERLYKKNGKKLTTKMVLDAARPKNSVLHKYFEWDDSKAAEKYRLDQAYQLILASKMVVLLNTNQKSGLPAVAARPVEVRRLVNSFRGEGFKMRNEALNEVESRKALIEKKISTLRGWCDEAVDIPELAKIRSAILKVLP